MRRRPPTDELDRIEVALKERFPWFYDLWPQCPRNHWMPQLGMNPEPFVKVHTRTNGTQSIQCVRCARFLDQEFRRRKKVVRGQP